MSSYGLDIISLDDRSLNKPFKKHSLDGESTIGVYENEPFEIRFQNFSGNKVQVRVSVDGTDVLTGDLAGTEVDGQMWVVEPFGKLNLKAWPETNDGGAEFLFGQTKNSVAKNTHGNLSAKGLIAVAVFEEGYIKPQRQYLDKNFDSLRRSRGGLYKETLYGTQSSVTLRSDTKDLAVGAGGYVEQAITKVAGLREPKFKEVLQLKYEWWTSLRSKLREVNKTAYQAFPKDREKIMDLGNTPRIVESESRVERPKRRRTKLRKKSKYIEFSRF